MTNSVPFTVPFMWGVKILRLRGKRLKKQAAPLKSRMMTVCSSMGWKLRCEFWSMRRVESFLKRRAAREFSSMRIESPGLHLSPTFRGSHWVRPARWT